MKEILKLIESVLPNDTGALDEIDSAVQHFLNPGNPFPETKMECYKKFGITNYMFWFEYTRSRNALKAIRPKGLCLCLSLESIHTTKTAGFVATMRPEYTKSTRPKIIPMAQRSPPLPTEELAELHAIIQSIQWERDNVS